MSDDVWREDARTDRAIELLRICAAKTDASGQVVPTYRYSRNFKHVAEHLRNLHWDAEETVTMTSSRGKVEVCISVVMRDGRSWEQEGEAGIGEDSHDWYALAACRALLHYSHDDGEPMTPDEVITMLEKQRDSVRAAAVKRRSA